MLANVARTRANNTVRPRFSRFKEAIDEHKFEVNCVDDDAVGGEEEQFMNSDDIDVTLPDYETSPEVKSVPIKRPRVRRPNTHQSTRTFVCAVDACAQKFNMKSELWKHNRDEHKDTIIAPKYVCTVCQKTFARERHLIMHQRMYTLVVRTLQKKTFDFGGRAPKCRVIRTGWLSLKNLCKSNRCLH
jgi:hypothetical protein